MENLIPKPVSVEPAGGQFVLAAEAGIFVEPAMPELIAIGQYLASKLRPSTGFKLPVAPTQGTPVQGSLFLTIQGTNPALGEEGYSLTITPHLVTLAACTPAGLFHGLQTIRQLLPAQAEAATLGSGPWVLPTGNITDSPRYTWRGLMLDVARHFFSVKDVKRTIDLAAYYKINTFHLLLTNDQGWRLEIKSWPDLTKKGSLTSVNGDPGGFYTQDEYKELVAYAQQRYITIVPEIDTPGHCNAALSAYAELNCDGVAPAPYTGIAVGFSSLCTSKAVTYQFLDDVIGEVAALTPGDYIHIGGDEATSTPEAEYISFIEKMQEIVKAHGKQVIGWEEISKVRLLPTSVAQAWKSELVVQAARQGCKVIFSPGNKTYLDMQYDSSCPLGLHWAGYVSVKDAYQWDPMTILASIPPAQTAGIEACLWSETLVTIQDIEFMAFPRLPGLAELAWSPQAGRSWGEYRQRMAAHGARLTAMGVNYYPSTEIEFD